MALQVPSQKDTTFTKIFVGGLPYHTTDDTLRKFFEQFGEIEEAVVITDRQTGKSKGYGFVTMADKTGADRAIKDPNPVIDGRKANVNLAYLGAKPRGLPTAFPFALKAGYPGLIQTPLVGIPQYVYQGSGAGQQQFAIPAGLLTQSGAQAPTTVAPQLQGNPSATQSPGFVDCSAYLPQLALAAGYTSVEQYLAAVGGANLVTPTYAYTAFPQIQAALAASVNPTVSLTNHVASTAAIGSGSQLAANHAAALAALQAQHLQVAAADRI